MERRSILDPLVLMEFTCGALDMLVLGLTLHKGMFLPKV